jgi:uncharacterized RDD family membrane protein YckC
MTDRSGPANEDPARRRGRRPFPARLFGAGARGASRAASVVGVDRTIEAATEEAIVRAVESPAVERALTRVLSGPVVEQATQDVLRSPAVEEAMVEALDSELVDRIWERVLSSDETQRLIERIAEAPELRAAIAAQGAGLLEDVARELREVARRLDDGLERVVWRLLRRPPRAERPPQAGAVSRIVAFLIDAGILNLLFFATSALIALVFTSLFPDPDGTSAPAIVLGTAFWIAAGALYLGSFWALSGQTPGMRFLDIQLVDDEGSHQIGIRRAVRRLGGTALAVLTLGLGFLGILLTPRRRGLPDRFAGTEVRYEDPYALATAQPD